jgi:hypothetical protein
MIRLSARAAQHFGGVGMISAALSYAKNKANSTRREEFLFGAGQVENCSVSDGAFAKPDT